MGKKRNTKKSGSSRSCPFKILPHVRAEITEIVDQLFKKCTQIPAPNKNSAQEWEKYTQIYELVENIREKEKDIKLPTYNRTEQVEPFMQWLKENSVKIDGVDISNYGEQGLGLITTKALTEGDNVISVPKALIISEETAKKSYLGSLIEKDPILHHMGNIALALHLLGEFVNPNSPWQTYLKILPPTFSTTLYFSPDEVKLMKGSPLADETVKQFQNIARQYSYFYRIFQSIPEARSWPIKDFFTFDSYRWAVSAVMTRVNRIPSQGTSGQLALIPAWDMANHEHGVFSTDFNEEKDEITCYAQRNFKLGEQFTIFYGQRSNAEFFLHSSFVYEDNPSDCFSLKLGVSKSDPLFEDKSELLSTLSLSVSSTFYLVPGPLPISPDLMSFARIFCMDKESLEMWKINEHKLADLRQEVCEDVDPKVQEKALAFLHTRVSLLQRSYPTLLEDDLKSPVPENPHEALIRSLLIEEKKILRDAAAYLSSTLSKK